MKSNSRCTGLDEENLPARHSFAVTKHNFIKIERVCLALLLVYFVLIHVICDLVNVNMVYILTILLMW